MNLQERIEILQQLQQYLLSTDEGWQNIQEKSLQHNNWFTHQYTQLAAKTIATEFLDHQKLIQWTDHYHLDDNIIPKTVGIIMAGNIPLVGFHDFLCVFISGHKQVIKPSSKDEFLLKHLVEKMTEWNPGMKNHVSFSPMLKDCDAYIATGSNNSARYFDYYFGRYPSVIRKNRTSVAILTGKETANELSLLADDIMTYFGLGCRNVTQIYTPPDYDFVPLLNALRKYQWMFDHHKYRNNYDYQLAIYLMNNMYYMTNDCIVLVQNPNPFSPIGTLHYDFYTDLTALQSELKTKEEIQAIVGAGGLAFGQAQQPSLMDYADGVDVMALLLGL